LVAPKDKNPQDQPSLPIAPASNPPKLGPALPETYVSPQQAELQKMAVTSAAPSAKNVQQASTISSALRDAGFQPSVSPTQKVGGYVQPSVSDALATATANTNTQSMQEGAWVKRNGKWKLIPKQQFQGGFNPGSVTDSNTGGFGTSAMLASPFKKTWETIGPRSAVGQYTGGRFAGDIASVVKTPFSFFKKYAGSPVAKVSSKAVDSIPYTEWAENVVGKTLSVAGGAGADIWNLAVRDTVRGTMTTTMTGIQLIENLVFFGAAAINYSMDDTEAYNKDVSIWDQARGVFTNTTLAQDLMGGDTGQGYLPGGPAEEERNKLEEKLRPKIFGQTGTVGRTFAALGVMANLYESGDDVHSLISGTLDAAFQVYFDPMNGIQIPKVLRTFADVPTAAVSTSDMRKLIKAGIAINKETLSKVDEVISQVDEASQLTDEAVNLLTPQPGTFWSGDRFGATRGQPLEKWNNLGPNGPTNPDNVLGSAGYVSNLSPLGTSYTVAEQGFERIDEMLSLPGGVEVKVPIVPPESLVYEFRVPETDFNIIDAETYWPVDPSVPWNLRSAAKDLGFDSETIEGFRQKLSDIGINVDVVPGANPLDEIFNSMDGFFANAKDDFVPGEGDSFDDFLASLETPEQIKLIKVRNILADPQTWLKKSLEGAASGSSRFFSNQRMEMLLQRIDDALSDEQYLRPGRGYEYPVSPAGQGAALDAALVSGNASDITTVSQSSKGRALTLVIDDPHTGGAAYFGPPVQMLQEFVSETDNWLLSWPEGSAENTFLTGIRAEGAKLAEDFLSTARKIDQKTPAPTTGTNPLNKELFEQGISELKDLSVRYENFYFDSIEKLQNSEFDPLILDQYRTSRLLFINNQGIENPIWYYQFKLNERVGVEITETGFRTKSLDTNIELGDVGPFKGATVSSNARSGSFDISFAKHEVLGIDNPSGIDNVNHWMQSKGVDAVRYDGGKRVGGYGSHEAMAVFAGEKLNLVAQRTGEQLPVALAKSKLLQGEELAVSADAIAKARGYLDAHGLIEAGRKTVGLGTYDAWKLSGTAKNMFKAVANNDNAYEIWATWLKGRSPVLAQRLADATTPEAVEAIMDGAVKNLDPKEHLRQLPGWSGNVVGEIGYRTKQAISKNSSFAATLPRSYSLPIDDLAAGTNHLHDTMIVLETPLEVRTELMNEYIRIISQDEPTKIRGDLFDFAKNFKDATIKDKIKPIVEKLKAPLLKTIEEMTPFERLTMNRRTQMVERIEELVKKTSTFLVNREEEVVRYTWDDVGRSVPLEWMDGNGLGPMYLVQQRTNEIALLPWDDKELTQLLKATSDWAEYSMLARSLPGMGQTMDALDYAIEGAFWLQSKWKRAVLFSGRYPLRVVPEEISRNVLSGQFGNEFGFVAELLTGRLNKDIYGRILPRITEADDLALKLDEALNVLPSRISRARARGNTRLADSLQKRLDKIDVTSTQARLDEVELMLESDVASARDVMIGPYPTKAGETALGPTVTKHMRKSSQQSVYRNENPELWLKGVSQAVMDRAADPLGASVARAMSTGATGALDKIAMEMFDGSLRIPYQSYYEGAGKLKPSYEWDSLAGAKRYVDQAVRDLTDITGGHEHLLSAIANNRVLIGGKAYSLGRRTAYGNIPSAEFTQLLKMGDPDDITIPVFASWSKAPDGTNVFPRASQFDEKRSKNVFSWWMQNAYGRSSDKFARIPMWNARKWNLIADMVPLLTKEEALKLKDSLPSLNLPAHVVENILDNIPRADGIGTLDILENTAGYYATQDTINLLFDSSKRTLFGRNHRLLFPFFDAFREVGAQMVKTAINPLATHKIDKAAEALGNLRIGGPGQTNIIGPGDIDGDSKDEGFVYRDPQTNSLSFNFPLIGGVARALTGIPFDFKVSVGSLSMATSVIPSVGPYVALTYSAIPYRQGETWDKLNKLIIPYGEPSGDLQDYFTPLAIQRFAQGVAAGTPLERVANFMGNPNTDPVYKTLQNRTFMAELASGKYSQDEAGVREAMQVSQDKGNTLWWLRGLTQFFSPGAPISQFYAKQGEQLVPLGTLLDSMRKTENDIRDKGGTFQDQMDAVVNQYGEFVIPFLASISETTVPGAESSKDFYKFKLENEDLFKRYPEVAGYFGPNTNEFDQEIYNIQKRAGELVALPKEEIATQVEQLWGNFRYNKADREFTQALGETPIKAYALSIAESQIKASLPSWNRALSYQEYNNKIVNSVNSIIKASNDPKLADLPSIPTLKEYLVSRNEIINVITRASDLRSVSSWRDNRGGIIEREALKIIGDRLAESNPDFKPLWDSVLSREFKTLTEQEKILAKTGQLP
jgi:hypothetical protein